MSLLSQRSFPMVLAIGLLISAGAGAQVTGTLQVNESRLQGASPDGKPLMYTPNPFEGGSSVSHWDTRATPNLLMEPSINIDLQALEVDLTDEVFEDLGWSVANASQASTPIAKAASFNIWSGDSGFTDMTPFAGAPGNAATTLGQARFNLFESVLARWGQILNSSVPIDVLVFWDPLPCDEQGAVLAAAGPAFIVYSDIDEFPINNTWYHAAQGESLVNMDLTGSPTDGGGDLFVFMNVNIDNECLGANTGYYYGLDGAEPANLVDAATVILHELGHGLGFSTLTNAQTGAYRSDMPSAFDHQLFDIDEGKTWTEMTAAERQASAINVGRLAWNGAAAAQAAQDLLEPGVSELIIGGSPSIAGAYDVGTANFGGSLATPLSGDIQCFEDGQDNAFDACSPATNAAELAGKIALINRGSCSFTEKAANAQAAGANAAVIVNNAGDSLIQMNGDDPSITIPVVSVGQSVGNQIRAEACVNDNAVVLRNGRFQVSAEWTDGTTVSSAGSVKLTEDTAYFWFFDQNNVEVVLKALDGCALNNHYWIFASGLTNVGVDIVVTDLTTGEVKAYANALNQDFALIKDLEAFDCP